MDATDFKFNSIIQFCMLFQFSFQVINASFSLAEDNDLVLLFIFHLFLHEIDKSAIFFFIRVKNMDVLSNVFVERETTVELRLVTNSYLNWCHSAKGLG